MNPPSELDTIRPEDEAYPDKQPDLETASCTRRGFLELGYDAAKTIAAGAILGKVATVLSGCEDFDEPEKKDAAPEKKVEEKEKPGIADKLILEGQYGSIYVWHPPYKGNLDDVVLHFHGFDKDPKLRKKVTKYWLKGKKVPRRFTVDDFWSDGKLRERFQASGMKALFIVPESSTGNKKNNRKQTDPLGLLKFVEGKTGIKTNQRITLMSHSGGGSTIPHFLGEPRVGAMTENAVTLDAIYDDYTFNSIVKWLEKDDSNTNQAIIVSIPGESRQRHIGYLKKYNPTVLNAVPTSLTDAICSSKIIHIESNLGHGEVKTLIPEILRYITARQRFRASKK